MELASLFFSMTGRCKCQYGIRNVRRTAASAACDVAIKQIFLGFSCCLRSLPQHLLLVKLHDTVNVWLAHALDRIRGFSGRLA